MGILGLLAIAHTAVYGVMTWEQNSRGNPLIRMQFMLIANCLLLWGTSAISRSGFAGLLGIGIGAYGTYFLWSICCHTSLSLPKPDLNAANKGKGKQKRQIIANYKKLDSTPKSSATTPKFNTEPRKPTDSPTKGWYASEKEGLDHLRSILNEIIPSAPDIDIPTSTPDNECKPPETTRKPPDAPQMAQNGTRHRPRPKYANLNMTIVVRCPRCSQKLRVPADKLLDISCQSCAHVFRKFTA